MLMILTTSNCGLDEKGKEREREREEKARRVLARGSLSSSRRPGSFFDTTILTLYQYKTAQARLIDLPKATPCSNPA